jgi:uncharacterized protein
MSDFSRRKFLKASVVGVGVGVTVEGCGGDGEPAAPGEPPAPGAPSPMPPGAGPAPAPGAGNPAPEGMSPPAGMGAQPPAPQPPPPGGQQPTDPGQTPPAPPPGMRPPPGKMPPGQMGPAGMPQRALGKTGLMVSIVGFGSGSQYLRASEAEAERLIHRAIELGITYFDTAISYGNGDSQVRLGKYLVPTYRDKVVLVSKIDDRTAEGAKRQLDRTLTNLKTDRLDILHFHHIDSVNDTNRIMGAGGAYQVMMQAKEQGIVKNIGLSGHSSATILLDALRRIKPDVMMCPQNAAREAGFTDMVIPYGQQNGIGLLGMKITAQDALLNRGVTAEELVRYSLSLPVSAMIIGMRSMAVLESCANVARTLKPLTAAEMMSLNGRLASLDTQRCFPYHRWGYRDGVCFA